MKRTVFRFGIFFVATMLAVGLFGIFFQPVSVAEDSASDIQDSLDSTQKKLEKAQQKAAELSGALQVINRNLSTTVAMIQETQSHITKAETDIERKQDELRSLEEDLDRNKGLLGNLILEAYYEGGNSAFPELLSQEDFFHALNDPDRFLSVGEKMKNLLVHIQDVRDAVTGEKVSLEKVKEEKEKLLAVKEYQKRNLVADQQDTQSDLQDQQQTITQLKSRLNSLRSEYSRLLGKSVSTDDILEAAKFAAKAVGMNKSFLLGVLVQESNKGQNVGSCDYKESKMSSTQLSALKKIADELDYNYKKLVFSCPPKSYSGTGGAMGVAQFMPTTWQGYKDTIASLTGHDPPDPWSLIDGVTAMASKLANDGASKKDRFYEAKSYCVYLAGGNWGYYCYGSASKYKSSYKNVNCWGSSIKNYGEKVLCLKDNYDQFY